LGWLFGQRMVKGSSQPQPGPQPGPQPRFPSNLQAVA
jgi:hypothetical protein